MRIDSFNDVDIKVYVDILHSSKSLSDESLKASLYKPSATLVEHEIAYYGRDAKGQFLIMNILGSEIDEIGEWDLVLTANDGSLFQSQKTLEAFEVVPNGQGDTLEPTCCDSRNCGMVTLYALMGQRANPCPQPCPCPTPTPDPQPTPTPSGVTIDTQWTTPLSDDHVPSSKLTKQALDGKQATLTPGTGITIQDNVISVSGGGSGIDIDTEFPASPSDTHVPSTKLVNTTFNTFADALGGKLDATTAESTYAKKTEIPTVPTQVSAFTNDAGYLTEHQSLAAYETSAHASETYETKAHAEATYLTEHQPLKTINNQSIIGTGNITIGGGGSSVTIDTSFPANPSDENVPSTKLVKNSLDAKADASAVPTKTSDLTNDSGFITAASVPQEVKHAVYGTTTYAQVLEWWNAGYVICCEVEASAGIDSVFWCTTAMSDQFRFVGGPNQYSQYCVNLYDTDVWSKSGVTLMRTSSIITSTDSTAASDSNVYSALAVDTKLAGKLDTATAATTYATKAEAAPELFECTYGETSFAEITAALTAGKIPYVKRETTFSDDTWYQYQYTSADGTSYVFAVLIASSLYSVTCTSQNVWSNTSRTMFQASNIIRSGQSTAASDSNVYSALNADNKFAAKSSYTELYVEFEDSTTATYKLITDND